MTTDTARRVEALRQELVRLGVDGFIISHRDEYQNEMRPPCNERLAFLTGFHGSMGTAVVLQDQARLFVDGRYILQAPREVDTDVFAIAQAPPVVPLDWVAATLPKGAKLGFDPWLHAVAWTEKARSVLTAAGIELVALERNPLDALWTDRPALPLAPAVPHPVMFAGEEHLHKRTRLAAQLAQDGLDGFVITDPASLAWLLNLRGADVPCVPVALGFGVLNADATVDLFMDARKIGADTRTHFGAAVTVHPPEQFADHLRERTERQTLAADMGMASAGLLVATENRLKPYTDPCVLGRARKNPIEVAGMRNAHRRDGVALVRFFAWLAAREKPVDELTVMERLQEFRSEGEHFRGLSFETIAGSGPNGAVVHYHATPATNRVCQPGEFLLIDSGGQYLDGTTDVTRTIAVGEVSLEMRANFTRVLKGHIAVARAVFPQGTVGAQLDCLARAPLWEAGLDFAHGTGHGVGSYLAVHEGPARICSPRVNATGVYVPLEPGMVLSDEPGYYKQGAYGIRTESLLAVVPVEVPGAEHPMLAFETLTLCPIDRNALELPLMTDAERAWLNAYHRRVQREIAPLLTTDAERRWLERATAPV